MHNVDAIVIGSGQGGVPLAEKWAREGREVVLFERRGWGGSCINYGCTPSKALLASAHAAGAARRAADLGVHARVEVDFPAVMQRIRDMADSWSESVKQRLDEAGVRTVHAEAAFTDVRTVTGGDLTVRAPRIVIDTGKSPRVLDIPGLKDAPYRTYVDFWQLDRLPARLLVMGAGYVGVELGQAMALLGSQVHVVEIKDRPIPAAQPDVGRVIGEALREDGVQFHLGTQVNRVHHDGDVFTLETKGGERIEGESLLVATGRVPNTTALKPEAGGIELDEQGHVKIDDRFHTTCEGVYAIGDVAGQPAFTHVSWEDHLRLLAILNGEERTRRDRVLGYAFFTSPQVGRAGMTLEEAQEAGHNARAVTLDLEQVARASETGRTRGFYRMVVDRDTDAILGATLISPAAAELIHVFIAHMESGSTWHTLAKSVHIHPTFAEGLRSLARNLME